MNTLATGGENALVLFKPTGTIIRRADLVAMMVPSPVAVELSRIVEPEFNDNQPVPSLKVTTEVAVRLSLSLRDELGVLPPAKGIVASLNSISDQMKSIATMEKAAPRQGKKSDDDSPMVYIFPLVARLGAHESRENVNFQQGILLELFQNPQFKLPKDSKYTLAQYFDNLQRACSVYGTATQFIQNAEQRLVLQPGQVNPSTPQGDTPANPLNPTPEMIQPPTPYVPSVTSQQVDAQRQQRQNAMSAIRTRISDHGKITHSVPFEMLDSHPELVGGMIRIVNENSGGGIESTELFMEFVTDKLAALFETVFQHVC